MFNILDKIMDYVINFFNSNIVLVDEEEDLIKAPELKEITDVNANVFLKNQTPEAVLFRHCNVLMDDLKSIKEHNTDVGNKYSYLKDNYSTLLDKFYQIYRANNTTLIDFLYKNYGIALWHARGDESTVYVKIENISMQL